MKTCVLNILHIYTVTDVTFSFQGLLSVTMATIIFVLERRYYVIWATIDQYTKTLFRKSETYTSCLRHGIIYSDKLINTRQKMLWNSCMSQYSDIIKWVIFLIIRIRDALIKADEFITIPGENKLVIDCTEYLYLVSIVLLKRCQRLLMIWLPSHYWQTVCYS